MSVENKEADRLRMYIADALDQLKEYDTSRTASEDDVTALHNARILLSLALKEKSVP